jgi:hypothetical protein
MKNPHAVALGRLGGAVKSVKKSLAMSRRMREYWASEKGQERRKEKRVTSGK